MHVRDKISGGSALQAAMGRRPYRSHHGRTLLRIVAVFTLVASVLVGTPTTYAADEAVPEEEAVTPLLLCSWQLPDMDLDPGTGTQYTNAAGESDDAAASAGNPCAGLQPAQGGGAHGAQVIANPGDTPGERTVELWSALDLPEGVNTSINAYWDVFYPDGNFKARVPASRPGVCADLGGSADAPGAVPGSMLAAAIQTGQIDAAAVQALVHRCTQGAGAFALGSVSISASEPCGAYRVEAHAATASSSTRVTSLLDVGCFQYLGLDVESIDWGEIEPGKADHIVGDLSTETGAAPTVGNAGSGGVEIGLDFAPMTLVDDAGEQIGTTVIDRFSAAFGVDAEAMEALPDIRAKTEAWFGASEWQTLCSGEHGRLDLGLQPPEDLISGAYEGGITVLTRPAGPDSPCNNDHGIFGGAWRGEDGSAFSNQRTAGARVEPPAAPAPPPPSAEEPPAEEPPAEEPPAEEPPAEEPPAEEPPAEEPPAEEPPAEEPPAPPPPPPGDSGDRQLSGPISLSGRSDVVIENLLVSNPGGDCIVVTDAANVTIRNSTIGPCGGEAVYLSDVNGASITGNAITDTVNGVLVHRSTSVVVDNNTFRHAGRNFVQFDKVTGSGSSISGNRGENALGGSNAEDLISVYQSGGTSGSPLRVVGNHLRNGGPSNSGSGIMLGDGGGGNVIVQGNALVNPGQVGIGVASGTNITVSGNSVYSDALPWSNVGIYVWNQYGSACDNIQITNNQVNWTAASGSANPWYNGGGCSNVTESGNNWGADIDPAEEPPAEEPPAEEPPAEEPPAEEPPAEEPPAEEPPAEEPPAEEPPAEEPPAEEPPAEEPPAEEPPAEEPPAEEPPAEEPPAEEPPAEEPPAPPPPPPGDSGDRQLSGPISLVGSVGCGDRESACVESGWGLHRGHRRGQCHHPQLDDRAVWR